MGNETDFGRLSFTLLLDPRFSTMLDVGIDTPNPNRDSRQPWDTNNQIKMLHLWCFSFHTKYGNWIYSGIVKTSLLTMSFMALLYLTYLYKFKKRIPIAWLGQKAATYYISYLWFDSYLFVKRMHLNFLSTKLSYDLVWCIESFSYTSLTDL